jgi:hypothetical protein
MIRQAHTYLVGAMGGATLIAIAIAAFVMLVSAQVLRNWPLGALGGEDAAVSEAQPAGPTVAGAETGTAGARAGTAASGNAGPRAPADRRDNGGSTATDGSVGTATGGGRNATEPGAGGGGGQGGADGGSPQTTGASSPGGGGSASSGGGANGGGKAGGGPGGSTSSPSGQVTQTVNDTVNKVDETALGGTLGNSGVTETTEGVVNGVAGPESTVGKVVDEAVGTVGGILGSGR